MGEGFAFFAWARGHREVLNPSDPRDHWIYRALWDLVRGWQ